MDDYLNKNRITLQEKLYNTLRSTVINKRELIKYTDYSNLLKSLLHARNVYMKSGKTTNKNYQDIALNYTSVKSLHILTNFIAVSTGI